MAKRKTKRSTKSQINWTELIINGLIDLIVGVIVALVAKLLP